MASGDDQHDIGNDVPRNSSSLGLSNDTLHRVPWKERNQVDEREEFVMAHLRGEGSMAELCRRYGVARKTGYKWVQRFLEGGMPGLMDRSRAPASHPHAVDEATVEAILAAKKVHRTWGAKKLQAFLMSKFPVVSWPSETTFARILKRHGLVEGKKPRRRTPLAEHPLGVASAPNHIWCADYKGKFRVGGRYLHPLTISDARSRYVLCCSGAEGERFESTKAAFEVTFKEYGLPLRIRSDNGSPFASRAIGGLSRLSVWWVQLGILPERGRPGHPQDNGVHERMHRTLKAETAKPPRDTFEQQQECFDAWRYQFNHERPHEALNMRPPADLYETSPRKFSETLQDPVYPDHFEVRRARSNGSLKFNTSDLYVGTVLARQSLGFEAVEDGRWQLWFGPIYLGLLTEHSRGHVTLQSNFPYQPKPQP